MFLCAARDYRDNALYPQLNRFFNCPLHAIKLKDGEEESNGRNFTALRQLLRQIEFHPLLSDGRNAAQAHYGTSVNFSYDVEFLAGSSSQHSCQVQGMT